MKINKITLCNFRQYEGVNTIDLATIKEKNIILIGGKNGYGKTNLLVSLVWCLYGEDMHKVDENFKREIQKSGNYAKFLVGSLNTDSIKVGEDKFSIEIELTEIELPETLEVNAGNNYKCTLKRIFDTYNTNEEFEITIEGLRKNLFIENEDKKAFVNDYLIPIEAAKFVFFDAEKIANWAELSGKEEGNILNDALGKILGLDIYESLVDDLEVYADNTRRESATSNIKQQIITTEKGIELDVEKVTEIENEILKKEMDVLELKRVADEYNNFLLTHGNKVVNLTDLEELYKKEKLLEIKLKESEDKFNEFSEMIPFAIASGKLEEVMEHLTKQNLDVLSKEKNDEIIEKNNLFVEKLFNSEPFPPSGDISFSNKKFYDEKAKKIIQEIFGTDEEVENLEFEHDLTKSDTELISSTLQYVKKQSKDVFEQTIDDFNQTKNEIIKIKNLIKTVEANQQDEEVIEYTNKKNEAERKIEHLIEEKGALQNQISQLKKGIEKNNQQLQNFIRKIEVSVQKKVKLDKVNLYSKALKSFIYEQKSSKCKILSENIYKEMHNLMHKMQEDKNFIAAIEAETLPDNGGLKITLRNSEGKIVQKETLSQGEKQIYISSMIKAILSLSIQEFPIFIDTPLGRLDDEHITNTLSHYYPELAKQVVLLATNNEISPNRFKMMEKYVAKTYLLENKDSKTRFKQGYF